MYSYSLAYKNLKFMKNGYENYLCNNNLFTNKWSVKLDIIVN